MTHGGQERTQSFVFQLNRSLAFSKRRFRLALCFSFSITFCREVQSFGKPLEDEQEAKDYLLAFFSQQENIKQIEGDAAASVV